jgi:NADH:ubiquinone oxidoreductase subunit 4 (subunit M)
MILAWFISILLAGGFLAWLFGQRHPLWARWIALGALAIDLVLGLTIWLWHPGQVALSDHEAWLIEVQ